MYYADNKSEQITEGFVILWSPIDDSYESQFDRNDSAHEYVHGVSASVHQIQFCHHSQRPPA